ncbi:tRNA pseudouridine(55) synthase TruB [Ferruginibacter yonginensis]|uniref:tRNA pseudouridine synthase B n=1 Tax=Ferruginibacter yonginensis TaxID=1310416 RepID=A0ABV8QY74_9BACT
MASKGSYYAKHKAKIHGTPEEQAQKRLQQVAIHEPLRKTFEEGKVLLIDKPLHWTSFDVVRKIRNSIKIKKVGHAGTLDPLATGLLIVCTGKFTKKINEYMAQVKEYTGAFTLGATTATYDKESDPENQQPFEHITELQIKQAAQQFVGAIEQFPPVYAAIKKDGVAQYELARRGKDVDLQARPITIYEFEITAVALPVVQFRVACSTGTYIRSLAHDIGQALQCGAYLSELRRTKIGDFDTANAVTLDAFLEQLKADNEAMNVVTNNEEN